MSKLDQFESVFRGASKARFEYEGVHLGKILLVTDLSKSESQELLEKVKHFLRDTHKGDQITWDLLAGTDYRSLDDLLQKLEDLGPDLVVTQRCLKENEAHPPYSLGVYLDVLTQITKFPILVLPDPDNAEFEAALAHLNEVVVMTNHLTGDSSLINWATRFVPKQGKLVLAHVEDDLVFEHYMEAISKIPSIDTETARESIEARLLKEPREFIEDVTRVLEEKAVPIGVQGEVRRGHVVQDYQAVVEAHEGDLLVIHTKDAGQMAMHGLAYAIAVEFRHVSLLML